MKFKKKMEQPVSHSASQPVSQSFSQSASQSVSQSDTQSVSQPGPGRAQKEMSGENLTWSYERR